MTHQYQAEVGWIRGDARFTDGRYSRAHVWRFDGGIEIPASASPSVVPLPLSMPAAVDPEEAFVAALASCHMLFFLSFAAGGGFVVERYQDTATGVMTKNDHGKLFISKVTLNPAIVFAGAKRPSAADIDALHHRAHEECFIANSVKTEVIVAPSTVVFD